MATKWWINNAMLDILESLGVPVREQEIRSVTIYLCAGETPRVYYERELFSSEIIPPLKKLARVLSKTKIEVIDATVQEQEAHGTQHGNGV